MRPSEQTQIIIQSMRDYINRLEQMSAEERQNTARQSLQEIGVLDQNGEITQPYEGVFVRAQ